MSTRNRAMLGFLLAFVGITMTGLAERNQQSFLQAAGVLIAVTGFLLVAYEDKRKQK